ncbi:MAG TPA: hypothetical protein DDW27_12280 [Bacteroidales bacterium]|nr:hypothetical protein [Bacteroidales bacterium]
MCTNLTSLTITKWKKMI